MQYVMYDTSKKQTEPDIINWIVSIATSAASCNEKHMRLLRNKLNQIRPLDW